MSEVGSPVWPANLWFSHWLLLLEMDCPDVQFVFQGILKLEKTFMFKPLICGDLSALQAQWHPVVWFWTEPLSTSLFAHVSWRMFDTCNWLPEASGVCAFAGNTAPELQNKEWSSLCRARLAKSPGGWCCKTALEIRELKTVLLSCQCFCSNRPVDRSVYILDLSTSLIRSGKPSTERKKGVHLEEVWLLMW